MKKERTVGEEISLEDLQQGSYMDGTTRNMIGNIGIGWTETRRDGREQNS